MSYQFDFLYVGIPPFKDNKKELIDFLWIGPVIIEFHHSWLENPTKIIDLMLLNSMFIMYVSMCTQLGYKSEQSGPVQKIISQSI